MPNAHVKGFLRQRAVNFVLASLFHQRPAPSASETSRIGEPISQGYFRFPAVFQNRVVFTSEDDLWEVPLEGGAARRLTAGRGSFSRPHFSLDGQWLAFASAEEGYNEVYVMPAQGGDLRRLTYLGGISMPCGWLDAETVLFRSTAYEAHNVPGMCLVDMAGGCPRPLGLGPASSLVLSETGQTVLARTGWRAEPSHWKRYRGGTAGKLWIAPALDGEYKPLIQLNGNLAGPLWAGGPRLFRFRPRRRWQPLFLHARGSGFAP